MSQNQDLVTLTTPESLYKQQRLQADIDESPAAIMNRNLKASEALSAAAAPPAEREIPELPGFIQGFSNAVRDVTAYDATKGFAVSVGRDTLHGIRALFSPGESVSAAVLSQMNGPIDDSAAEAAGSRLWAALSNQEGRDLAAEVAEAHFPGQGPNARLATNFALSVATDPTSYIGVGLLPALRHGIRKVGTGKAGTVITGAIDDLAEKVALPPKTADELYNLAKKAELGDKSAITALGERLGPYAKDWELASVKRDDYRLGTVGGRGKTVPTDISRAQKTLTAKRKLGDPQLFMKELDSPMASPYILNRTYLDLNGPEDVVNLGRTYTKETTEYVTEALKKFPADTKQGLEVREMLAQQKAALSDNLGDVLNKDMTDIEAFAYRRMLSDIGGNILQQAKSAEMKFDSNVDRLRFYKLIATREVIRGELALEPTQVGALLGRFTTASKNPGVRVVQADRAMAKLNDLFSGKEETLVKTALGNLKTDSQVNVFLNQVFAKDGLKKLEANAHSYWINSILSGPVTHARNMVVNAMNIMLRPVERGMVGDVQGAKQMAIGMVEGTMDTLKVMANRKPPTPLNYREYKHMHEMSESKPHLSNEALKQLPITKQVQHFLTSNILGGPTKALGTADQVFKAVAQRQDFRAQAVELASKLTENPQTRKQLTEKFLRNPMMLMQKKSFQEAEKMTFQNPLSERAADLQKSASRYGVTKWVVPFVKTPLNIVSMGARYTPYAPLFKQVRSDLAKGGIDRQLAVTRMMVMPTTSAAFAALMGDNITGGQNLYTNQNELPPYSIKFGNGNWIPYKGIEPLRWMLGPAADLKDILTATDWDSSDASSIWGQAIAGIAGAYLKPIMDTLFLGSLSDVAVAVSDMAEGRTGSVGRIMQNYALGMVPNAMNQVNRVFLDTSVHELDGFTSKLKSRIPGLSESLPPRVGYLGESQQHTLGVTPSAPSDHTVYKEFQRLGIDIPQPPRVINGHELTMLERAMFRITKANPGQGMTSLADAYDGELKDPAYMRPLSEEPKEAQRQRLKKIDNDFNKLTRMILMQNFSRLQKPAK